jgi:hypothetical protein
MTEVAMPRWIAAALFALPLLTAAQPAAAEINCSPHCDYNHDYGPYDFTYIRPGLFGFPRCNARGDCSPYLVYTYPRYSITVRPRTARPRR